MTAACEMCRASVCACRSELTRCAGESVAQRMAHMKLACEMWRSGGQQLMDGAASAQDEAEQARALGLVLRVGDVCERVQHTVAVVQATAPVRSSYPGLFATFWQLLAREIVASAQGEAEQARALGLVSRVGDICECVQNAVPVVQATAPVRVGSREQHCALEGAAGRLEHGAFETARTCHHGANVQIGLDAIDHVQAAEQPESAAECELSRAEARATAADAAQREVEAALRQVGATLFALFSALVWCNWFGSNVAYSVQRTSELVVPFHLVTVPDQ
jgi:hypothetical protein